MFMLSWSEKDSFSESSRGSVCGTLGSLFMVYFLLKKEGRSYRFNLIDENGSVIPPSTEEYRNILWYKG